MIRFLQDNVVAIHDHAWGDGKLFAKYHAGRGFRLTSIRTDQSTTS